MAEDWLADVLKYDANADPAVVKKIVNHCGIALRSRDASLVAFSDKAETDRVRESFLKKKLARTDDDSVLDAAIAAVGETMKADRTKNRVTVYYLLAQHFDQLDLFGGTKGGAAAAATAAAASAAGAAAASAPAPTPVMSAMSSSGGGADGPFTPAPQEERDPNGGIWGVGALAGLIMFAAIMTGALVTIWANNTILYREPAPVVRPAPPPPPAEPAIPEGAGVISSERDELPMLTVYFDTGSAEVTPDFEAAAADVMAYLEANEGATLAISGFNDPTGNAELNAALSRDRAMGVQAALVSAGVAEDRTDLVRPDDTTTTDMPAEQARRVEVTIVE